MVLSVDYIRNVQTHFLLGVDQNHAGDIRHFNPTGAAAAINATLANCGAASVVASYTAPCPSGNYVDQNGANRTLTMADYAALGLGSSADMGGSSCQAVLSYACAFGGINQNAPPLNFLSPVGRSVYNGLQTKWVENVKGPFRGAKDLNFQVSYALSKFDNSGGGVDPVPRLRLQPAIRTSLFRRWTMRT